MLTLTKLRDWCGRTWFVLRSKRPSPLVSQPQSAPEYIFLSGSNMGRIAGIYDSGLVRVAASEKFAVSRRVKRVEFRPHHAPWGWCWQLDWTTAEFWPNDAAEA